MLALKSNANQIWNTRGDPIIIRALRGERVNQNVNACKLDGRGAHVNANVYLCLLIEYLVHKLLATITTIFVKLRQNTCSKKYILFVSVIKSQLRLLRVVI